MGKSSRQIKAARHGNNSAIEHVETTDDSYLPEAEELAKYQAIDPNCLNWLKARAEQEQSARLSFNDRRMRLFEKGSSRQHVSEMFRIFSALLVILSGMALSAFLVYMKMPVHGTIFAGGTILIAATAFLKFKKDKSD